MSENQQQTNADGTPKQDATGTLIDQSPPPTDQTPPKGPPTDKSSEKTDTEKSLLNQDGTEKKPEADKKPEAKADAKGPPEKYEFKLPEGYTLDEAGEKEATELFKGLGLDQAGAQRLVDFHASKLQEAQNFNLNLVKDTQEKWLNEIKADPEIGGKLDQVKSVVSKAIDSLGPELAKPFREAMDMTGVGNNPAFIRAFHALALQVTEGGHVSGQGPTLHGQKPPGSAVQPTAAQSLYPELASKG